MTETRHPITGKTDAQIWAGLSTDKLSESAQEYESEIHEDPNMYDVLGDIAHRIRAEIERRIAS